MQLGFINLLHWSQQIAASEERHYVIGEIIGIHLENKTVQTSSYQLGNQS